MADDALQSSLFTCNCLILLGLAILYYDHFLTFHDEIRYIWLGPRHKGTYWFLLNRYLPFFGNLVFIVLNFYPLKAKSCTGFNVFHQVLLLVTQVIVGLILALRVYALHSCNLKVLCFVLAVGCLSIAVATWTVFSQHSVPPNENDGGQICTLALNKSTTYGFAGAWEALLLYDSICFYMTLRKSYQATHRFGRKVSIPLISLMLRDGAMYFGMMVIANASNVLTFYFTSPYLRGGLSTFASAISVTMMNRLMLNLHENAMHLLAPTSVLNTHGDLTMSIRFGADSEDPTQGSSTLKSDAEFSEINVC